MEQVRQAESYLQSLVEEKPNPFGGKEFRRIYAERNILPEIDDGTDLGVFGDGRGATNIIQNFINKASLDSRLVERTLLKELNEIFLTDAVFSDIVCQQLDDGKWEIYLEEESKGRIPLSQSGSGLKTIILVLVHIHLIPQVIGRELSDFIFGFEELENNLHPAMQRRLLSYLRDVSVNFGCIFFLTTHSNVEIDLFSKDERAQIVHVTHDGLHAKSRAVTTYIENRGILDDLDVRASDLLQANGIVWVEGPSDRIYLNRWIELWSEGVLKEGHHYQCVFYGGRLLAHLSSEDPGSVEDGVCILSANRNCAILIDSDKRAQQSRINDTKQRIASEVRKNSGFAWVTKGREIENYIPSASISSWTGLENISQVDQYQSFFEYLNSVDSARGDYFLTKKAVFAEKIVPHMDREMLIGVLDLERQLEELCNFIKSWNTL